MLTHIQDIGLQGLLHLSPDSAYHRTIAPFLARKHALQLDAWGRRPNAAVDAVIGPLVKWIDSVAPTSRDQYPTPWDTERQMKRAVLQVWVAGCLQDEFAGLFKDLSKEELEACAASWRFEACVQREGMAEILKDFAAGG